MLQSTLKEINDRVFDFLLERHYRAKEQGNPELFLFVMAVDNDRLTKKLWLPGDEESIYVSFLTRAEREAAIYIRISIDGSTTLILEGPSAFLPGFVNVATIANQLNLVSNSSSTYSRTYPVQDYLSALEIYLKNDHTRVIELIWQVGQNSLDRSFTLGQPIELGQFYKQFLRVQFKKLASSYQSSFKQDPNFCSLNYLHVRNFRGIRELTISGLANNVKWIFLTGENGFGKTSVLQAIGLGLWGIPDRADKELSNATIECVYNSIDNTIYNDISHQRYTFSVDRLLEGHVAFYGSSRLQTSETAKWPTDDPELAALYHLYNTNGKLLDVEKWLLELYAYRKNQFGQVVEIIKALIPSLHRVEVSYPNVDYYEVDEEGTPYNKGLSFRQLAAGFQNIIALICDMLRRLKSDEEDEDGYGEITRDEEGIHFLDLAGIVIIDELELHLHPKYQRELPKMLTRLFPSVQFIASTHSPIPLLGAPLETEILKVNRSEEAGITIERLNIDFSTLLPNAILTSPIFGFDDIIPESAPSFADVETEDNYDEAVTSQRLKGKLKILKAKLNND